MWRRRASPLCVIIGALLPVFACAFPANIQRSSETNRTQVRAELSPGNDLSSLQELQQENLLQTGPSGSSPRSTNNWFMHRRQGVLHLEEQPPPFIFDLRNFPELANMNVDSQNPNIQVTIEVEDDAQTEVEIDLAKENQRNDWSVTSSQWASSHRKLFWPLFWKNTDPQKNKNQDDNHEWVNLDQREFPEQSEDRPGDASSPGDPAKPEDPRGTGGLREHEDSREPEEPNEDGGPEESRGTALEEDWSAWTRCSATCGRGVQKRTRSCGVGCTAAESQSCDLQLCTGSPLSATELSLDPLVNRSDSLQTNVDSCEKWLTCKNDFLQRYLHQVLTELPSCPCSYPSETVYGAVHIPDSGLRKTFRWRDASGQRERLDIYKPSARFCIRSMLSYHSTTLAAQHCCYDDQLKLITRGKGRRPNLISTEFSPELHFKLDVLPWILCKGDWSRVHTIRPPNNGLGCGENPLEDTFQTELEEAREY